MAQCSALQVHPILKPITAYSSNQVLQKNTPAAVIQVPGILKGTGRLNRGWPWRPWID